MADVPTLIAEVGFSAALTGTALHLSDTERGILGTNTLASADLFVDVSEYTTSVTTARGARRADGPVTVYETGNATANLRNDDRRFDPTNLAGPYVVGGVTQVEPLRAIRWRATWAGVTYPLWRGFTDRWQVGYDGPDSSWASVACFDAFGVFAAQSRGTSLAVGAGETTGARINRVLDGVNWPESDRVVSTGVESVQATTLEGSVLSELQLTADTELGELWMDAQGRVMFRDRSATYSDARSRYPSVHFGDQVGDGDTTVNLASNPSVETSLTGWVGGGFANQPTISRSSTRAVFGTYSLLGTWATAGGSDGPQIEYTATGLTEGRTYTASVYAYVPSGSPLVGLFVPGLDQWGTNTGGVTDQWVRLTWTGTATSSTLLVQVWPKDSTTTSGQQVYLDGLQIEEGPVATEYVDGAQPGGEWDAVAHTSTSRRLPELPATDIELAYDALSITNRVSATRAGGTEQTAENSASVSKYLVRSYPRSDLLMQTDAEALMWAEQIVERTAVPELRIASVTLRGTRDERLWPHILGREIGDRVRVTRRPPGGGDPIVREGWIRGIEHRMAATQEWETVFALEQARDQTLIEDRFGRTVSDGWGDVESGGVSWTTSGGSTSDYAVSSGTGRHTLTSAMTFRTSLVEMGMANQGVTVDVTVPVVPTGGAITVWLVGRAADLSNYYAANMSISTSGAVTLSLYRRSGGTLSSALASTSAGTHSAGNTWRLQINTVGTTVRGRAWRPGIDFQPGWTSTTDSTLTAGTKTGVLTRRETGNTNTDPVIQFDTFIADGRHWWD